MGVPRDLDREDRIMRRLTEGEDHPTFATVAREEGLSDVRIWQIAKRNGITASDIRSARPKAPRDLAKDLVAKKAWRINNPDRYRASEARYKATHREQLIASAVNKHLLNRFGITTAEYQAMLAAQGGVCVVCGRPPGRLRLCVDHDHRTGVIRGLLCNRCNTAAGLLDEDPVMVDRLAVYIRGAGTGDAVHKAGKLGIRVVLTTGHEETLSRQGDPQ